MRFLEDLHDRGNGLPPRGFDLENAWEIRERNLIATRKRKPTTPPKADRKSIYAYTEEEPRYLVENEASLGIGGISKVYLGWDRKLERLVAVKRLRVSWKGDEYFRDTIELEAKTMAKLQHPGLPKIHDYTEAEKEDKRFSVLIMEYIASNTLAEEIDIRYIPKPRIAEIITQTASTIDYVSKFRLHHRDIKPNNIMLPENHTKLIDFGSSNWAYKLGTSTLYSPPESQNSASNDLRSDVYSLAATAYHALFGLIPSPIPEESSADVLDIPQYHFTDRNERLLSEVFTSALSQNIRNRHKTATQFANQFQEAIS